MRGMTLAFAVLTLIPRFSVAAPIVHVTDFIPDDSRTNFVDFESLPPGCCFGTHLAEDGVSINQLRRGRTESDVDAPGNNITSGYNWGNDGQSWYPSGGDFGFTQIRREGGLEFSSIGFLHGSGNAEHQFLAYALLNDGVIVLSGTVAHSVTAQYLGFAGGGFDEIWLRDRVTNDPTIDDNTHNALAIDSIELADVVTPVTEPASILLLGVGLCTSLRQRRR
jgi:hypothetical protein